MNLSELNQIGKTIIVQRLLDEKHITAEEAVVLLQNTTQVIPALPYSPPINPYSPNTFPIYPGTPFIYSTSTHTPQE